MIKLPEQQLFEKLSQNLMPEVYHVLNGDALKAQFPSALSGEQIVARECLVDGPVEATDTASFWKMRASFMAEHYGTPKSDYEQKSVVELTRLSSIEPDAEVNLWFEEDLFCQVNMWFVVARLLELKCDGNVYWVRPEANNWLGFGGADTQQLMTFYQQRIPLNDEELSGLAAMWRAYQGNNNSDLNRLANHLSGTFSQLPEVVKAHIDRHPATGPGRPQQRLVEIMESQNTRDFATVFTAFSKTEGIYGFGDMQVKRLLDELIIPG